MDLKIELKIPEGQLINNNNSADLVKDLAGEIDFFLKSTEYKEQIHHETHSPKNVQGAFDFALWIVEVIETYPTLITVLIPFIKHIAKWSKTKLKVNSKKGKKSESPGVKIEIDNLTVILPSDEKILEEFIKKLKIK